MEDMGRGTVREERGNPVTRGISEAKPRSRFKLPYPIDLSTCPHNEHTHTLTHKKKAIKNETIGMLKRKSLVINKCF